LLPGVPKAALRQPPFQLWHASWWQTDWCQWTNCLLPQCFLKAMSFSDTDEGNCKQWTEEKPWGENYKDKTEDETG